MSGNPKALRARPQNNMRARSENTLRGTAKPLGNLFKLNLGTLHLLTRYAGNLGTLSALRRCPGTKCSVTVSPDEKTFHGFFNLIFIHRVTLSTERQILDKRTMR